MVAIITPIYKVFDAKINVKIPSFFLLNSTCPPVYERRSIIGPKSKWGLCVNQSECFFQIMSAHHTVMALLMGWVAHKDNALCWFTKPPENVWFEVSETPPLF